MKRSTQMVFQWVGLLLAVGGVGWLAANVTAQNLPTSPARFPLMVRIAGSDASFKFLHREHGKTKIRAMVCKDCHVLDADGVVETVPQHPQCVECHLQLADVKPPMFQCAECHVGYVFDDARRTVSYGFTHKSHLMDKKTGKEVKCEACHQLVAATMNRFDMTLPAVRECLQCHNGRDSFIVYDCLKCHNPITTPDSHRLETLPDLIHGANAPGNN